MSHLSHLARSLSPIHTINHIATGNPHKQISQIDITVLVSGPLGEQSEINDASNRW